MIEKRKREEKKALIRFLYQRKCLVSTVNDICLYFAGGAYMGICKDV